jgi:hypothetical protein
MPRYWVSNHAVDHRLRVACGEGTNPRHAADSYSKAFPDEPTVFVSWLVREVEQVAVFERDRDNLAGKGQGDG